MGLDVLNETPSASAHRWHVPWAIGSFGILIGTSILSYLVVLVVGAFSWLPGQTGLGALGEVLNGLAWTTVIYGIDVLLGVVAYLLLLWVALRFQRRLHRRATAFLLSPILGLFIVWSLTPFPFDANQIYWYWAVAVAITGGIAVRLPRESAG
jgi:hypothetical protein